MFATRGPGSSIVVPGVVLLVLLFLACFARVLFQDEQFGYRDAAHYYYPLYERVQQEWDAGRLPLWEPEENSGMPLLGNPTAAVLYPGKLIYTFAPSYAWGARLYILAHVVFAVITAFLLARGLGLSHGAALFAGTSYAFGVPVLFQYCNVIFLVGASWIPIGFLGADQWLRRGRRIGIAWLSLALAMAVLGGDPQATYLMGTGSAGYALALAWSSRQAAAEPRRVRSIGRSALIALLLAGLWFAVVLGAELALARSPADVGEPPKPLPWARFAEQGILLAWAGAGLFLANRWLRKRPTPALGRMMLGLGVAAALAVALSAAQLLPAAEFTSRSTRASAESNHDIYPFSLEPARLVELLCPGFYGTSYNGNSFWFHLVPPRHSIDVWIPSLYIGCLTAVLAAWGVCRNCGRRPAWVNWMLIVGVISLAGSLGKFSSPLWMARNVSQWTERIGHHDPQETPPVRLDGHLRDGDGGVYWALATFLPGFGGFRYAAKLTVLFSLAAALLAGHGWDCLLRGADRRIPRSWLWLAGTLLLGALALFCLRSPIVDFLTQSDLARSPSVFGRFQPAAAWFSTIRALLQPGLVLIVAWAILKFARHRWIVPAVGLLGLHALDLGLANRGLVLTVPQSLFNDRPEVLKRIEQAEASDPMPGKYYRVHRMPAWQLLGWGQMDTDRIHEDYVRWERRTIQPKYAVPYGLAYTMVEGVSELYDYMFFFPPFEGVYRDQTLARSLFPGEPPKRVIAYPRRGFDLWNTRYFVLPYQRSNDTRRGVASFLFDTRELAPGFAHNEAPSPERSEELKRWGMEEDWHLLRNEAAYPRAWVVHDAKVIPPITGMKRKDREALMFEILYQNDPFWSVSGRPIYDPRSVAWLEVSEPELVAPYRARTPTRPEEAPRITLYEPQRVELEVDMQTPGFVILADVDYPGWKLAIDGKPAPILRANRLMRGAGVPSGHHKLVYTYEPQSVRWGLILSGVGVVCWLACFPLFWRHPLDTQLATLESPRYPDTSPNPGEPNP